MALFEIVGYPDLRSSACDCLRRRPLSFALSSSSSSSHVTIRQRLAWVVLACVLPVLLGSGVLVFYSYSTKRALTESHTLDTSIRP